MSIDTDNRTAAALEEIAKALREIAQKLPTPNPLVNYQTVYHKHEYPFTAPQYVTPYQHNPWSGGGGTWCGGSDS